MSPVLVLMAVAELFPVVLMGHVHLVVMLILQPSSVVALAGYSGTMILHLEVATLLVAAQTIAHRWLVVVTPLALLVFVNINIKETYVK
jgi:hypothetical protein